MTHPLTELIFIGIIAGMLLLLAGLHTIAKYRSRKRIKPQAFEAAPPIFQPQAKIISLPQYVIKQSKNHEEVQQNITEKEMV